MLSRLTIDETSLSGTRTVEIAEQSRDLRMIDRRSVSYGETPMRPPLKAALFSAKISPSVRLQTTIHTLQRENLTLNDIETLHASGAPSETMQLVRRRAWCIPP